MKKLLLTLLSSVVIASPAFALVGGPWDSNIPGNPNTVNPSNINGTYQGTIKGTNLSGVMMFGTSTKGAVVTGTNTVPGFAIAFFEGTTALAAIDVVVDLGARRLSGVVDYGVGSRGGSTSPVSITLVRPATATSAEVEWEVIDNIFFNGYFNAKLSKSWANNSFKGTGFLLVKKVDFDGFYRQLITDPTTATPQIVTTPLSIKVAGVKTSDTPAEYSVSFPKLSDPQIQIK